MVASLLVSASRQEQSDPQLRSSLPTAETALLYHRLHDKVTCVTRPVRTEGSETSVDGRGLLHANVGFASGYAEAALVTHAALNRDECHST